MLPSSHLLQLVPARVKVALDRINGLVWHSVYALTEIEATEARVKHRSFSEAAREPLMRVSLPQHWGMLWDQRWCRVKLPAEAADRDDLYLTWGDQSESTLYVDGVPHYGLDVAHTRAPLPRGLTEVWIESVVCQTAIGHENAKGLDIEGSLLTGARLVRRDEEHWQLYHDLLALYEVMEAELRVYFGENAPKFHGFGERPVLHNVSPLLRRLLRSMDEALNAYELSGPASARARLAIAFGELKNSPAGAKAVLTGHAHIDLVWLWPENAGEFKAVHTFSTANRLMERYPEYRFGYSQPASYAAVGRRSPELIGAVKQRIRQGRWDAEGAAEVESDSQLPCGEALARSFLIGQRRFTELRGSPSPLLWLPDVFGYSPCLPQLMKQTGVEYFYTAKLSWSALTRFPYSSFVWRGHDGSEIVSHITHAVGYCSRARADQLRIAELAHRQSDVHPEFLVPCGFGDGGGGTTEEMIERARRFSDLAGVPRTEWGNLEPFFDRLGGIREKLPVFQGELCLEYHRGTYTTQCAVKAAMRAAERALQVREAVRCALALGPMDEASWRRVVFAQFHDFIPGTSIHEVYAEGLPELQKIARDELAAAGAELDGGGDGAPALFNPLPRSRLHLLAGAGGPEAVLLPPLGGGRIADLPRVPSPAPVVASVNELSNDRLSAGFDEQGRVVRLVIDGRELALRDPLGELVVYSDRPAMFEAWDIDRSALSLGQPVRSTATITVSTDGTGTATVACARSLGEAGEAVVRYTRAPGAAWLSIEIELEWKRTEALLKILFPTRYAGRQARYGTAFGSVLRSQVPGELADEAKWEVPASRWAAVIDETESEGLFVVTEAKYGFSCRDGVLGLSLVRSAAMPGEGPECNGRGSHPFALRREHAPSRFSDLGRHVMRLAIGRHDAGAPRDEQPAALADLLFQPVVAFSGVAGVTTGFAGLEGGETLQPTWAKPADGGGRAWVLRLNETLGRRGSTRLRLASGWKATMVDLREQPVGVLRDGAVIDFTPYALLSVLIEPAA